MKTSFSKKTEDGLSQVILTHEFNRPEYIDESMFSEDTYLHEEALREGASYKDLVFVDRNIVIRKKNCIQLYWSAKYGEN